MFAWRRSAISRQVSVSTKTGKAIAGVLVYQRGPLLILKDARLLEAGRAPVGLDGDVLIERSNVDFVQVIGPAPEKG